MQVFVAGATGLTGKQVVAVLRAQGIEVVAGVRVRPPSLLPCFHVLPFAAAQVMP
jgi:nucleoside-diphosphate-sugar epimerase